MIVLVWHGSIAGIISTLPTMEKWTSEGVILLMDSAK